MKGLLLTLLLLPALANGQIITTFAGIGSGGGGFGGDGGPATAAYLALPTSGAFDSSGNYYFAMRLHHVVRKVSTTGIISTIAGINNVSGYNSDGIASTAAQLNQPTGVAVDHAGNLYIADFYNHRIRKVDVVTGIITTVAGNGTAGFGGDSGPATTALLNFAQALRFDTSGNLYIADYGNLRVRKVNTTGIITTYAGNGNSGYIIDGVLADTTSVVPFYDICIDNKNNLLIVDRDRIRKVNATTGIITTIAGNGTYSGTFTGDGGPATNAGIKPFAVTCDKLGALYVTSSYNKVLMVDGSGIIHSIVGLDTFGFSGDGGPATAARLYDPEGLATDACDNLYIADCQNARIRRVVFNSPPCPNLGTDEVTYTGAELIIYPNPATNQLTIAFTNRITTVSINNLLGQTLFTHEYNSQQVQVNVADLPTGMYLIRINGSEVRKFVKE